MSDGAPEHPSAAWEPPAGASHTPPREDPADVVGRRVAAALVDFLVLFVLFLAFSAVSGGAKSGDGKLSFHLGTGGFLAWLAVQMAYYWVCESSWGQTPGKRALGIRVVSEDGDRPIGGEILVRTLLRIVDALPTLYLLGFVVMLTSSKRQRLGDRAAHTIVVRA